MRPLPGVVNVMESSDGTCLAGVLTVRLTGN
jgi:hypothetical protein